MFLVCFPFIGGELNYINCGTGLATDSHNNGKCCQSNLSFYQGPLFGGMSQAQMVRTKIRIDWFSSFREKVKRCVYKSVWLSKIKSTPLEKKLPYKLRLLYLFGNVLLKNIKKKVQFGGGGDQILKN